MQSRPERPARPATSSRLRRARLALVLPLTLLLSACASYAPQDTLRPKGPFARAIDNLWDGVFAIAVIGSVAAITFAAFDPTGGHFGVLPDQGSISREVADRAFRRAYSTALGLAAAGAFLAAALAAIFVRDEPKPAEVQVN